jgi:hypothetical protein
VHHLHVQHLLAESQPGERAPASVLSTRIRAAGRWYRLSKAVMSWRMSVTNGGFTLDSASSGSTTVSPWPSIPRSSRGLIP